MGPLVGYAARSAPFRAASAPCQQPIRETEQGTLTVHAAEPKGPLQGLAGKVSAQSSCARTLMSATFSQRQSGSQQNKRPTLAQASPYN